MAATDDGAAYNSGGSDIEPTAPAKPVLSLAPPNESEKVEIKSYADSNCDSLIGVTHISV